MSDTEIQLGNRLGFSRVAVTKRFGWVGISGGGKSYAAMKFAEELNELDAQMVVIDVIGNWWGLRLAADGVTPGIPIYVFGGLNGDIPLEPTSGAVIADVVVDTKCSVILDISEMTEAEQHRFVTDFAIRLLQRKKRAKSPLHLFWEEVQEVCPETPGTKACARCVAAVARLAKQGRNFGIGSSFISQRPQAVAKEILNQVECLLAFSTSGPQEIAALKAWIKGKNIPPESIDELKTFEAGECYVWSPAWLKRFDRVRIGSKWTFDSTKTPEFDDKEVEHKPMALDLKGLSAAVTATIERAKENDPVVLKAEVMALRAELARAKKVAVALVPPGQMDVVRKANAEITTLRAQLTAVQRAPTEIRTFTKEDEQLVRRLEAAVDKLGAGFASAVTAQEKLAEAVVSPLSDIRALLLKPHAPNGAAAAGVAAGARAARAAVGLPGFTPPTAPARPARAAFNIMGERAPFQAAPEAGGGGGIDLPPGEHATLTALIQYPTGLTREQLRGMTGYKRSSVDAYLKRLKEKCLVGASGDRSVATPEGIAALPSITPLPTGVDLRNWWRSRLPDGEARVLDVLIHAYPESVDKEYIREATEYKRSSVDAYLKRMKLKEIVAVERGAARAADVLFLS